MVSAIRLDSRLNRARLRPLTFAAQRSQGGRWPVGGFLDSESGILPIVREVSPCCHRRVRAVTRDRARWARSKANGHAFGLAHDSPVCMATMQARNVFEGAHVTRPRVLEAELDAPWCVVVKPSNDTFLYVVRHGSCLLDSDGLGAPLSLRAGDIVTLVAGQRHVWRDG